MSKGKKQRHLRINISVDANSRIANGINYIALSDATVTQALGMALSCLYSPVYKALQGESLEAIEKDITLSRSQFEMLMAFSKALHTGDVRFSEATATTELRGDDSFSPPREIPTLGNGHHLFDAEDLIDLTNEVL